MNIYQQQIIFLDKKIYPHADLSKKMMTAKSMMDAGFGSGLTIDIICKHIYISKFHFIRSFNSHYGVTPHQYLMRVRMKKAKQLLLKGENVTNVFQLTGYESHSAFTKLFRRFTGQGPSAFQKKAIFSKQ